MKPYTVAYFLLLAWPFSYMYINGGRSKMSTRHVSGTYNHENDLFIWLYWFFTLFHTLIKKFNMCLGLGNKIQVKKNVHSLCVQFLQFLFSFNILILYFWIGRKILPMGKNSEVMSLKQLIFVVAIFISIKIIQDYVFNRITLWGKEILHLP